MPERMMYMSKRRSRSRRRAGAEGGGGSDTTACHSGTKWGKPIATTPHFYSPSNFNAHPSSPPHRIPTRTSNPCSHFHGLALIQSIGPAKVFVVPSLPAV
eukprot:768440-Hanusia_phi.AAC.5